MGKNEYLDGENLEWQERLFRLRKKYRETPPGFREAEEEEKSLRDLRRIRKEYEERKKYRIRSGYRALQECFVGRERYLTRIEEILAEKSGPAVLYGIGGIGKTAIARAYVRRHQEEYDSVLFLSCDIGFSPLFCDDIRVAVSNLHYSKDKYGSKKQYFKEKMKALTEIGEESRFLLVLDDCNREADPYMEQIFALPCDILVTTRVDPAMWGVAGGIPVTELEPGREWEEFVRAYRGSEPTQEEWKEYREYPGEDRRAYAAYDAEAARRGAGKRRIRHDGDDRQGYVPQIPSEKMGKTGAPGTVPDAGAGDFRRFVLSGIGNGSRGSGTAGRPSADTAGGERGEICAFAPSDHRKKRPATCLYLPRQTAECFCMDSIRSRAIPGTGPIWKTRRSSRIYLLS